MTVLRTELKKRGAQHSVLCWGKTMKNFFYFFLIIAFLGGAAIAEAQQQKKIPQIGFLAGNRDGPSVGEFQRGLRDLGYVEGKNILIEYRYTEGKADSSPSLVTELVQLKVNILVVTSLAGIRAAKQATKTIPVVIVTTQDPVATGIVDSLARPGGNITGVTTLTRELGGKRMELLKEAVVGISRVAVLRVTNAGPGPAIAFKEYEAAAGGLKIELQSLAVLGPNPDLEGAFQTAAKGRASALIVIASFVLSRYSKQIAELAIKNRMPSMNEVSAYVEAGGLMSYAANNADQYRRAAYYVDKILKGTKPADLPVEQPTKFELVINLKTANQIGLTISPNVLARADKVIK
jgi:putative tryptophan/tyrosine transport system substrate-binding protein